MNCIKCGREIEENQVFCPACLEEMGRYPVKPGVVVHIPKRTDGPEEKRTPVRKRLLLDPEEQIRKLKKKVLWLRLTVAVLLLACGLLCFAVGKVAMELDVRQIIGQNYSTVETDAATGTTEP